MADDEEKEIGVRVTYERIIRLARGSFGYPLMIDLGEECIVFWCRRSSQGNNQDLYTRQNPKRAIEIYKNLLFIQNTQRTPAKE